VSMSAARRRNAVAMFGATALTLALLLVFVLSGAANAQVQFPAATPGYTIELPRDEGSHPQFRTEWWYLTGWLEADDGMTFGFQVTFFRHRPGTDEANPSRFAAKQLLLAHVSLSDARQGRLLRDEKTARAGFGLAEAREGEMDVRIDDWHLWRRANDRVIHAAIGSTSFTLELRFDVEQPPLLQGRQGFSQKGPAQTAASYYYSLPQLRANGHVFVGGKRHAVRGTAWLDHEWFSSVLDEQARGWDWAGLNLEDGSSLMVFRMRDVRGEQHWAAATWRDPPKNDSRPTSRTFESDAVEWRAVRRWRSARTGVEYPVEWQVRVGERTIRLRPFLDDQENDARGSTGTLYWEGAVRAYDEGDRYLGRGYLELTGYGDRIQF
jgi:predicted secreted hydrolase